MNAEYLQGMANEAIGHAMLSQRRYQPPIKRKSPKIGRNEPCGCGSGIKNKKCCNTK